jgi:bacteriorhodopsin
MFKNITVSQTTDISIYVQIIALLASGLGIFYKLPKEHQILNRLLIIETIVQSIELGFYLVLLRDLSKTVSGMAKTRYYDWAITTPNMLLTTIIYFEYKARLENNEESFTFTEFIENNKFDIIFIVISNYLMVYCGYLGEIGKMERKKAAVLGSIFLLLTFGHIYNKYAKRSKIGRIIFGIIFTTWSMYGIAFLLNEVTKNNVINYLDLLAKNFFAIFLFFEARRYSIS